MYKLMLLVLKSCEQDRLSCSSLYAIKLVKFQLSSVSSQLMQGIWLMIVFSLEYSVVSYKVVQSTCVIQGGVMYLCCTRWGKGLVLYKAGQLHYVLIAVISAVLLGTNSQWCCI